MVSARLRKIPSRLFGGRVRTSTVALIAAFVGLIWLEQTYEPPPPPPEPVPQFVPPGFVPNPEYTWVPQTDVRRTTTTTPPTETTTTTPTTTTPTTTSPGPDQPPASVVDPDGPGPLAPTTVEQTDRPTPGEPPFPWAPQTPSPVPGTDQQPQTAESPAVPLLPPN